MDPEAACRQVSVLLENRAGRLEAVCRALAEAEVNIRGLCIAEISDFGVLRLIVSDPDRAVSALKAAGFAVGEAQMIALTVEDRPGGLLEALDLLARAGINVEYMYALTTPPGQGALVVLRVADERLNRTLALLKRSDIRVLPAEEVYAL